MKLIRTYTYPSEAFPPHIFIGKRTLCGTQISSYGQTLDMTAESLARACPMCSLRRAFAEANGIKMRNTRKSLKHLNKRLRQAGIE